METVHSIASAAAMPYLIQVRFSIGKAPPLSSKDFDVVAVMVKP
jgi:hypothetical protein